MKNVFKQNFLAKIRHPGMKKGGRNLSEYPEGVEDIVILELHGGIS